MGYYRINNNLTVKDRIIKSNTIADLDLSQEKLKKLLNAGVISELSIPPLAFMPMWENRAERLSKVGIESGIDLLNSKTKELSSKLKITPELFEQWKTDLIQDLIVENDKKCCGG